MNKEIYKLIVAGNINIPSMINSIIAATIELRENNTDEKDRFNQVHIFHTEESLKALMSPDIIEKWQHALDNYNISHTSIIHHVTKIEDDSTTIFRGFVEQLKTIINPFDNANYYVDLTSGLTAIKGILAVFSYVVDIEHIYTLEINFTKYKEQRSLFYTELINENVEIRYKKFPAIKEFDDFGKLNYTEIIRHREIINNQIEQLSAFLPLNSDLSHLKSSLLSSVNSRLLGDVTKNIDNYRQSVFSSSASVEEMSNFILNNILGKDIERGTLGQKLEIIRENYGEKNHKYFIDPEVLKHMTLLISKIRNKIVHHKNNTSPSKEMARIKSYISSELSYAFLNFTIESLSGFVDSKGKIIKIDIIKEENLEKIEIFYFGIDGDNTGKYLEESFNEEDEIKLMEKSKKLRNTINKISNIIKKETKNNKSIIFAEGDNILFKGKYDYSLLKEIQNIYFDATELNCSIGFGVTLKESSIALKLSKSKSGNSIVGVKLI